MKKGLNRKHVLRNFKNIITKTKAVDGKDKITSQSETEKKNNGQLEKRR